MFDKILLHGKGESFISFANSEGKRWIVPVHNMRTAMNLYQPSGTKGKLIKHLLPYVYRLLIVKRVVGFEQMVLSLNPEVDTLIKSIFKVSEFEFSVFGGTPSVHQKITIQISNGNTILGYCKLTDNEDVKNIFRHEQSVLNSLHKQNIIQIPQCLYCGSAIENIDIFVQSTTKTNKSNTKHTLTDAHYNFSHILATKTAASCTYKNSDLYKHIDFLSKNIELFSPKDRDTILWAIRTVEQYYSDQCHSLSGFHADFTPWNTFFEKNALFVFDFEYYEETFPPYMDMFHFIIQIAIIEKNLNSKQAYKFYRTQCKYFSSLSSANLTFLCYLLYILSFYYKRKDNLFNCDDRSYKCWIGLIEILRSKFSITK